MDLLMLPLLLRYMYKPMGGRRLRLMNVWVVFIFVAVWHDIEMKLLVWGLLNSVFFVLEVSRWAIHSASANISDAFDVLYRLSGAG